MSEPSIIDQIFTLKHEYHHIEEIIDPDGPDSGEKAVMYLGDLMRIRKQLASLSVDLAKQTAKYGRSYKKKKAKYEYDKYKETKRLMEEGTKVTAAESKAKQHVASQLKAIAVDDGLKETGKLILAQVNEVLKSLNQDISIIKKEYAELADS